MKRHSLTCKCLIQPDHEFHHLDSGSNRMIFTPIYSFRNLLMTVEITVMYVSRTTSLPKSLQFYVGEKLTKPRKNNLFLKNQTDCSYI